MHGGARACLRVVAVSAPLTTPGASEPPSLPTFTDELPHRYPTLHLPTLPPLNRLSHMHAYDSVPGSSPALFTARLPPRLVARIESLEYVEMAELLQEAWLTESTPDSSAQGLMLKLPRRSSPITDISVWVECFCLMSAVLCARYPARGPDLMMYLRRIVHCARKFEGHAWVTYNRLYRRQAAAARTLSWATEDQALYNEAFSGRAKPTARCKQCLSEHHSTDACPDIPRGWPITPGENPRDSFQPACPEVCRRYNQERCHSPNCRFRHACSSCSGGHPASRCSQRPAEQRVHPFARGSGRQRADGP